MTKRFEKIDPTALLGQEPTGIDLEIGFGQSSFVVEHAQRNPSRLVIGVEVRKQAVAHVQDIATKSGAKNILLVYGNGSLCLQDMFHDAALDTIFIFHPDPWVKRRHHKRRLINPAFIELCLQKLKPGGKIHLSTDVQELWQEIEATLAGFNQALTPVNDDPFWATEYTTRWDDFSKRQQRKTFWATFRKR
ncbi:MAG: tRNA (guanosine(46)-N7)-methyltransferase TrmB [Candidatus Babeliales bacterium]|jgi:tRNA (guanine-N7-)-methyltransferase